MTTKGIFFLVITGLLGAWLFILVYQSHQESFHVSEAQLSRDSAEFDADFARAFNGKSDPRLDSRAEESRQILSEEQANAKKAREKTKAKMQAVSSKLDDKDEDRVLQEELQNQ